MTNHHQQAAPRVMIVLVGAEMIGQGVDASRQEGDLDLRRPGIGGMRPVLFDNRVRALFSQHARKPLS
jgi:hypothetical protein